VLSAFGATSILVKKLHAFSKTQDTLSKENIPYFGYNPAALRPLMEL
jgi:hypothetical protein